ncbi:hypothetical protein CYLTODRAFT_455062 [Cylindrobasidium torrendii FP15055 ss-10]|uniref:Yeast cell wall synthesis Kre9/Knh1-like N-terminal domain-containing protein n=1 Tax=Cylindrobasidium torrendii FP15055 ss-10 TaxID=1314674 RepID=A0A0D7B9F8_9AGAR|nr:hypothetical protein CYLTODRAFT_455062 [Cylindrobasidium torrendii FP15055 ss-10]
MFATSILLAGLASSAYANLYLTSPVASTSWASGDKATITWEETGTDYSIKDFGKAEVSIAVGSASSQTKLYVIGDNVDMATTSSIEFTVDGSIGASSDAYFIRIDSKDLKSKTNTQYPEQAFSAKFKLTNMNGSFNATVQKQIDGASDSSSVATSKTASSASTGTKTATSTASGSGTAKLGAAAATATAGDGALSLGVTMWAGVAVAALAGFMSL